MRKIMRRQAGAWRTISDWGGGGVSYDNDQRFRLWVVQIYFLIGVKVNRQVQLRGKFIYQENILIIFILTIIF